MDFSWSKEQVEFRQATVAFARTALNDGIIQRDRDGVFSRELWQKCAEFGIQGLPFPQEFGGVGADILTTMLAMEGLGYGCKDSGLIFGINAQMWSVQTPIFRFGSTEQKRKHLPKLCSGEWIGAHAMTEPDSGSDAFSLRTTAERCKDYYVVNGTKTFVSNGPVADVFVVFATIDRRKGLLGLTGFIVERDFPGFYIGKEIDKMGLRTSPMAELVFENCKIPVENRLGREGRGGEVFNDSMEWERSCILSSYLGSMERQLEACLQHARTRRQFGKPIGEFQLVANRLVNMKVRMETARLMLYKAAWIKQHGGNDEGGMEAAITKLYLSECWVNSCLDAVQIHGGYGFTTEYEVERDLRDSIGSTLYSGTSEIQRSIIARNLGL